MLFNDASRRGRDAETERRNTIHGVSDHLNWVELPERKGMQFATLSGNPKTGSYTQIRKVPAGTDNEPHSHSSEIKNVIISGVWYTAT